MKICVVRVRVCLYKILRLPAVTVAQGVLLCVLSIALCGPFNPWPGPGIVHAAEGTPDSSGDTSDDTSGYAGDPGDAGGMTDSDPDHSADSNRADVVVDESGDDESGDHFEDDADDDNDGETEAKGFQASVVAALQRGREIDGRRNTAHHGVPIKDWDL